MIKNETTPKDVKIYGIVVGGDLNVRKGPSMEQDIVKMIPEGQKILIKEPGRDWHKIVGGYVMAKYIKLV